jgi:hypothetical protein
MYMCCMFLLVLLVTHSELLAAAEYSYEFVLTAAY